MVEAFVLGLIGGVIPGPVLTCTFTEILQRGLSKGMRIVLLAVVLETGVGAASVMLFSVARVPEAAFNVLSLIGAVVLMWIAVSIWRIKTLETDKLLHLSFKKIAIITLTNGLLWTFWFTVCVPRAAQLKQQLPFGQFIFVILFELGWLASTSVLAVAFERARPMLSNPRIVPAVFKLFALTFVYFAVSMAIGSIVFFARG